MNRKYLVNLPKTAYPNGFKCEIVILRHSWWKFELLLTCERLRYRLQRHLLTDFSKYDTSFILYFNFIECGRRCWLVHFRRYSVIPRFSYLDIVSYFFKRSKEDQFLSKFLVVSLASFRVCLVAFGNEFSFGKSVKEEEWSCRWHSSEFVE